MSKNSTAQALTEASYTGRDMENIALARPLGLNRVFLNTDNNISVRSDFTRSDYDYYRTGPEADGYNYPVSVGFKAYENFSIVRNIIDLMGDFTCKGIKLVHRNAKAQRIYNSWWKYVNGDGVSERFSNYLYRCANVPINITYGTLSAKIERKWASADVEVIDNKQERRRIPLRYNFINPLTLDVLAPEITAVTGKPFYRIKLSYPIRSAIARLASLKDDIKYQEIIKLLPKNIMKAMENNSHYIDIDGENLVIYYYKKDDWDVWAKPLTYPLVPELQLLEKMRMSDMAALDGAMSTVRLWKLGNLGDSPFNTIIPSASLMNKLRNILAQNVGGGTLDLVWGPDIDFKESDSKVYQFLGASKYEAVLAAISDGLGVPIGSKKKGGSAADFIGMQTFIERLEYGRKILVDFWDAEIKKVQLALGLNEPAVVSFEQMNLSDPNAYKNLLLGLYDRDVISIDSLLENFRFFSDVEKAKIKRDYKERKSGKVPAKSSPYHNPMGELDMKKSVLQNFGVLPKDLNEDTIKNLKPNPNLTKLNGRPQGQKDTVQRKKKKPTFKTKGEFSNLLCWAMKTQDTISEKITPVLLKKYNKTNLRSLSYAEFDAVEETKFRVLSRLKPYEEVSDEVLADVLSKRVDNDDVIFSLSVFKNSFIAKNKREPEINELRQMQSSAYALTFDESEDIAEIGIEDSPLLL